MTTQTLIQDSCHHPRSRRGTAPLLLSAALLAASLGGCVVAPAGYGYDDGAVVTVAPPAPRTDYIGVAPAPGYIWMGGYWNWVGGRHVWVGGHWSAPRPGYHWVNPRWAHARGGWRLQQGHWAR